MRRPQTSFTVLATCLLAHVISASLSRACHAEGPDRIEVRTAVVRLIDRAELATEDNGLLSQLNVRVGEHVKKGDVLASLRADEAKLMLEQAALELKHAQIEANSTAEILRAERVLEFQELDWARAKEAAARSPGAFSLSELDRKKLDYEQAKLDLVLAKEQQQVKVATAAIKQHAVDQARHLVDRRQIRASMDGVVERVDGHPGEWVQAGEPLILLVNANRLRVQGLIAVEDFHPRLEGARASLNFKTPRLRTTDLKGIVSFVSTENEPRTKDIRIWVDFDNPGNQIRPGMQASVWIDRASLGRP